jgi:hypothetical protein
MSRIGRRGRAGGAAAGAGGRAAPRPAPAGAVARPETLSRRGLLGGSAALLGLALAGESPTAAGAGAAGGAAAGGAVGGGAVGGGAAAVEAASGAAGGSQGRARRAVESRIAAARLQEALPGIAPASNGDETALPGWIASYSKGLPHDALGEVDGAAYRLLLRALASGRQADFESIPLGGFVKLANPQAGLAVNLVGPDAARVPLAPAPRFGSAEQAAELVELYWQALLRDVPFDGYEAHPLAARAAEELSRLAGFQGPRDAGGRVTAATLFRGGGAANLAGPYVSQFLYQDVFLPPMWVPQRMRTAAGGEDYLMAAGDWLACQNGAIAGVMRFDPRPRRVRNGRDLAEFVHRDFSFQAALDACLVLLKSGAPANGGNPYKHSRTQSAFATFGAPCLFYLVAVVTQVALNAAWYQKWWVHRRLRPEEYAGRVEIHRAGRARYPIPEAVLASRAVAELGRRQATALLPCAYPEGAPMHPSYPAAHAVIAAAGTTVLKACFDESYLVPNPVVPAPDGLALHRYDGPPLAIGDELDKLAWNVGMGRNFAGIHWRSDLAAGLRLGEELAIAVLAEMKLTGNELFSGFSLRRLDGRRVRV